MLRTWIAKGSETGSWIWLPVDHLQEILIGSNNNGIVRGSFDSKLVVVEDQELTYFYEYGNLTQIRKGKRTWFVNSQNGLIESASEKVANREVFWFLCEYNEAGNPTRFLCGPIEVLCSWSDSVLLKSVIVKAGEAKEIYEFSYGSHLLLSSIKINGTLRDQFSWGNPDYYSNLFLAQPDYLSPIRLISCMNYDYISGVSNRGINLVRTSSTGVEEKLIYNPFTEAVLSVDSNGRETLHKLSELEGGIGAN